MQGPCREAVASSYRSRVGFALALAVDVNPLIELSMTDRRLPASSRSITADVMCCQYQQQQQR